MTVADQDGKRRLIVAFFDDLNEKLSFLEHLVAKGRCDEARVLCVCYIDGLSNWLHDDPLVLSKNFVAALTQHSDEQIFSLIVPEWLDESLPWRSAPRGAQKHIREAFGSLSVLEAYLPNQLISIVQSSLTADDLGWLKNELWRGSVAMSVYINVRSRDVHWLGAANALVFSPVMFMGNPLPPIDFQMLHRALRTLVAYARKISLNSNKWFGLD